ncbi:hypothetical protein ACFC0M_21160 [Streptomyces sp. NPDC056149]|nr:hypothetical protein [Streptomyces sp. WZ-12]
MTGKTTTGITAEPATPKKTGGSRTSYRGRGAAARTGNHPTTQPPAERGQ